MRDMEKSHMNNQSAISLPHNYYLLPFFLFNLTLVKHFLAIPFAFILFLFALGSQRCLPKQWLPFSFQPPCLFLTNLSLLWQGLFHCFINIYTLSIYVSNRLQRWSCFYGSSSSSHAHKLSLAWPLGTVKGCNFCRMNRLKIRVSFWCTFS